MPNNFSGFKNVRSSRSSSSKSSSRLNQKRRVISPALCPLWNFSHSNRINFVMFAEGMACPERQLNHPLKRGGDKKRVTELPPKDAVMTMGAEEGSFVG